MPRYGRVHVTVYTAVIQSFFEPGGMMNREANRVADTGVSIAKLIAPVRTGTLRGLIRRTPSGITSRYNYVVTIMSYAPHGLFVEEGTTTPITPFYGQFLSVPRGRGSLARVLLQYVRGQDGQHYLYRGMDLALAEHGYPGKMHPTFGGEAAG